MKSFALQLNNDDLDISIEPVRDSLGQIASGMLIGNTLYQNQALLLSFHAGDLKEAPTVGIGLSDALLAEDLLQYRHEIRKQFSADGMEVKSLSFYEIDNLKIDAEYLNS